MSDVERSLRPAPARPGKQSTAIVAAIIVVGLWTGASGCRQSGNKATPTREEAPAIVALQKGVIVVTAGNDKKYGDDEEVMEIIDVTPEEV